MFLILNTSLGTALGQASDEAWIWVRRPYGACRDGHPVASRLWEGICCVMAQAADGTPILVNESKPSTYIYPEGTSTHLRVRRWYPSIHLRFLLAICLFAITYQYAVLATTGKRLLSGVCKIPRLRPLSHRAGEKVRTQSCLPIFASCMLC